MRKGFIHPKNENENENEKEVFVKENVLKKRGQKVNMAKRSF